MKLQVTQENLAKALTTVARVASTRGTLPILANVLLSTANNRLSIAATNLDIAISQFCGSKVATDGSITIPARLMQDVISSLPNGIIDLELEGNKLHVVTDQYQSTINGVPADDFPVMPAIEDGTNITISGPALKRALGQVVFAASSDESRPVLTGVYVHTTGGELFLAATDSYRLAAKMLQKTETDVDLLVPVSAMQDVLRIVGDFEDTVLITYNDQQVQFQIGDVEVVARLIEGKYPPYQTLLPKEFVNIARVKRTEFVSVAKVSSLFARESAGSIKVAASEVDGSLSIQSVASQIGENKASASGQVVGNGEVTVNSRYLLDSLHAFAGEEVEFCFNGKLDAVVLRDPADPTYTHLIMPLKS